MSRSAPEHPEDIALCEASTFLTQALEWRGWDAKSIHKLADFIQHLKAGMTLMIKVDDDEVATFQIFTPPRENKE